MITTLPTYQIRDEEENHSAEFVFTPVPFDSQDLPVDSPQLPEKLRAVITKLQQQDIGWLDILKEMANLSEQLGDEQVAKVLEATVISIKRNRRVVRNL
jgi:hypothetical protein